MIQHLRLTFQIDFGIDVGGVDRHGFINTMPEIQTVFIAYGAAIQPGVRLLAISNLRVAPTIAKILGVNLPQAEQPALDEILKTEVTNKR